MANDIGLERLRDRLAAGAQLVEVLPPKEYAQAHLPGALNLPLGSLHEPNVSVLDRDRPVIVYCWDSL